MRDWVDGSPEGLTVGELATIRPVVQWSVACHELDILFRKDSRMRSVVVAGRDGTTALINRTFFYQALLGPKGFGWALYQNKPIEALPSAEAFYLEAALPAVQAGLDLMKAGVSPDDDVLVKGLATGAATLGVSTLFAQVADYTSRQADRFRTLIQNLSDVVLVIDARGSVRYLSPSFEAITGWPISERLGQNAFSLVHPDDRPALQTLLQRSLANPGVALHGEFRMTVADGTWRRFEMVGTNLIEDPNICGLVINYRDVTERRLLEDELRHQALHDPLTGLANRTLLIERVDHALVRAGRSSQQVAVLYLDLDGFKAVNDTCGHSVGDDLLIAVAGAISAQLRPGDTVARIGGDEFAIVLEGLEQAADAALLAGRLHLSLEDPFEAAGRKLLVRASIGVAVGTGAPISADDLIRRADLAMYAAKAQGKNRSVHWGADLERQLSADQELGVELQEAIDRGQLVLHYQPIVSLSTGELRGVEALVRWQHPSRGLLAPDKFIPLAERTGTIVALTRWVLAAACTQGRIWQDRPLARPLVVSVNISGVQIGRPELNADILSVIAETGLRPELLELEITETALVTSFDAARAALQEFKRIGIRIAIDDFGTGYSSLSYLHQLPVDVLKIDKSFIDRLSSSGGDDGLIRGLITLAHSLKLEVTAEGIEQLAQHDALLSMGCDQAQGYLYARPGPAAGIDQPLLLGDFRSRHGDRPRAAIS